MGCTHLVIFSPRGIKPANSAPWSFVLSQGARSCPDWELVPNLQWAYSNSMLQCLSLCFQHKLKGKSILLKPLATFLDFLMGTLEQGQRWCVSLCSLAYRVHQKSSNCQAQSNSLFFSLPLSLSFTYTTWNRPTLFDHMTAQSDQKDRGRGLKFDFEEIAGQMSHSRCGKQSSDHDV